MKDENINNVAPTLARVYDDKFRLLVEHSLVGIYIIQDDRFVYVNPTMAEIFGFSPEELTSAPFLDFVFEEDRKLVGENVRKRIQGQVESIHYTLRAVRKDGAVIHIEAHGSQTEYEGKSAALGMLLDITERKQAANDREKANERLIETSHQVGMVEVATGILHNVGNVLCSVNVSSFCLADKVRNSKVSNLLKVVEMLREHEADLGAFITVHPKGKQLPGYLAQLAEHLAEEQSTILKELAQLQENIGHIKENVAIQQNSATVSGVTQIVQPQRPGGRRLAYDCKRA
jgi:PAS domain S-box-containing protein